MQVMEVIRRWQQGESQRAIARATRMSRNTVEKYIREAEARGLRQGVEKASEEVVRGLVALNEPGRRWPGPQQVALEGERERIARWLGEERLQLTRVQELLGREGTVVSYTTLRRYVREAGLGKRVASTVRMADWPPGEVAEMDFEKLGRLVDTETGKQRTLWALLITLPYSRHSFVWPLFQQTLEESIGGLEAAWRFFGGVPKRLILDNFPAAIAGPDALEPRATRGFLEYSQARGFLCDPARVRKPRDKPHVERGVPYVRERFFKGGAFRDLADCREQAERWCREVAGKRIHGTTRQLPLEVFEAEEQKLLQPYDGVLYDVPAWREVKVHPDYHVSFIQALYSVPAMTCPPGTKLEARADGKLVKLYKKGQLIKVHPRQARGGRSTDVNDYPTGKADYALRAPERIVERAKELGPNVEAFARRLFDAPYPWARLRQGQKLISLGEKYTAARLDAACERCLLYGLIDVRRLHRILERALDIEPRPADESHEALGSRFARPPSAFDRRQREVTG